MFIKQYKINNNKAVSNPVIFIPYLIQILPVSGLLS